MKGSFGRRTSIAVTLLLAPLLLASPALAVTITWTGMQSTSWHTPGNWNLNRVPGAGDDVVVPNVATSSINYTSAVTTSINSLSCSEVFNMSAGTLTIAASSTSEEAAIGSPTSIHTALRNNRLSS